MIKICDALMSSGKSCAAINYMNERPHEKFVYITPYLDEAKRIHDACPSLRFVEPSGNLKGCKFSKCVHTAKLISEGRNVASTHQAFRHYTKEMLEDVKRQGYTLIIDESVDFLESFDITPDDVRVAEDGGYISRNGDFYRRTDKEYNRGFYKKMFDFMENREFVSISGMNGSTLYCWALSPDLITSFKDTIVLTYLLEAQSFHHFLVINQLAYEHIGVDMDTDGKYYFCDTPGGVPEYASHLGKLINIVDSPRMNGIGDKRTALSMAWFDSDDLSSDQLKKHVYNCTNNVWREIDADRILWGTFTGQKEKLKGKGYTKSFLAFNMRATNEFRKRDHLIYAANVFMNVGERLFYQKYGVEVNEDLYALSIMVQWIWRSAIRDGKPIYIYVPSRRMRELLIKWIRCVSGGGDIIAEAG